MVCSSPVSLVHELHKTLQIYNKGLRTQTWDDERDSYFKQHEVLEGMGTKIK